MTSFHTRSSLPIAPTATSPASRQPQVQRAQLLADNYWTSAAWRSSFEWRRDDERAAAAAAAAGREPPQAVAPHYMWQDTATARAFIKAKQQLEETKEAMSHDDQQPLQQQPPPRPSASLSRDSLDDLSTTAASATRRADDGTLSLGSRSSLGVSQTGASAGGVQQQQQQQQQQSAASTSPPHTSPATNTLAGFPFSARPHAAPTAAAPTGSPQSQHRPRSSGRFPLRGAGALPTHRATTGASRSRLAADAAARGVPAQADLDWSAWARAVQRAMHPKPTKETAHGRPTVM